MTAPAPFKDFTFAFQPILDTESGSVFAYEALIRGTAGEPANAVFARYRKDQLPLLDREARVQAVRLAAALGLRCGLSLNFMPHTLDTLPNAISSTLDAAAECGLRPNQLILEVTEGALIEDPARFAEQVNTYRAQGIRLAIDDFGAGYAGLNLLSEFQPDIVKLDMNLVRDVDSKGPRQAIARAIIQVCDELGLEALAEGVESEAEQRWFARRGVRLFQGYLIGRPALGELPEPQNVLALRKPRRAVG